MYTDRLWWIWAMFERYLPEDSNGESHVHAGHSESNDSEANHGEANIIKSNHANNKANILKSHTKTKDGEANIVKTNHANNKANIIKTLNKANIIKTNNGTSSHVGHTESSNSEANLSKTDQWSCPYSNHNTLLGLFRWSMRLRIHSYWPRRRCTGTLPF